MARKNEELQDELKDELKTAKKSIPRLEVVEQRNDTSQSTKRRTAKRESSCGSAGSQRSNGRPEMRRPARKKRK